MPSHNCLEARVVFCMWTGTNAMSTQRIQSLFSIFNQVGCPIAYLNARSYGQWQRPEQPFHPAFAYLSETHKSDYLRVYLMHHYGGGYTDIKPTTADWNPFFDALDAQPDMLGAGYTEIGPHGVAPVGGDLEATLKANHAALVGLCAFIFRAGSAFTAEWLARTHRLLDAKHDALREHPARHPQDRQGAQFTDGSVSPYPLKWTELLGDIFHPLIYEYRERILHLPMAPQFSNYR